MIVVGKRPLGHRNRAGLLARRLLAGLAAALLLGATTIAPAPAVAQEARERTTASDESDVQRRARIRMELAANYYAQGQMTTALDEVKQALQAVPDLAEGYNLRGLIYSALGDAKLADESFSARLADRTAGRRYAAQLRVLQLRAAPLRRGRRAVHPRAGRARYRSVGRSLLLQGVCQARSGDLAQAEKTLLKAYEVDAGNPATAMNLAEVLYRRGDYERARFYVRRVNNQAALKNVESLWLAARVERKLGNDPGARELGTQLRERYPTSREAAAYERGVFDD